MLPTRSGGGGSSSLRGRWEGGEKASLGRGEPCVGGSGGSGARAPGGVTPARLAGAALPASRSPRSCSPSLLPASSGKLPAHAATFPPASTSSAPRILSSSLLAGGAEKGPRGLPGGLRAGWREVGSRRANSRHRQRAPRGRAPGTWGPVPAPPVVIPRGRRGPKRSAAGPQPPTSTPSRPLQHPASGAGCPAFRPLPGRARPRLLRAPYLLSAPSLGRGWAAARPREPCRRLPLALPGALPRADRSGRGVCRKRKITTALETQPLL